MKIVVKELIAKSDERGDVVEIFRPELVGSKENGQVTFVSTLPGKTRGNHFHKRKTEWYCVMYGEAIIAIENNKTKEKKEISVNGKHMVLIKIPPNHRHWIKNIGNTHMHLLIYVNEPFNPLNPDTYYDEMH